MNRKGVIRRMWLLLAIVLVTAAIAYPSPVNWLIGQANTAFHLNLSPINLPFVLGLDLQGGSRLEYSADVSKITGSEQSASIDGVRDAIERRVNTLGVSEPLVQTAKAGGRVACFSRARGNSRYQPGNQAHRRNSNFGIQRTERRTSAAIDG